MSTVLRFADLLAVFLELATENVFGLDGYLLNEILDNIVAELMFGKGYQAE